MNLLKSNNISYIKYGIFLTRKQLTLELNPPLNEFIRLGFTQQLSNVLESFITDEQIVVNLSLNFKKLTTKNSLLFLIKLS